MSFFRSTPTSITASFPFQSYLFPSLPFRRRRKSSTDSSSSTSSYLPHHTSYLRCTRCSADLCPTTAIVSRGFTGRWGRAYLVSASDANALPIRTASGSSQSIAGNLPNTTTDRPVARQLVTGPHTVSDIRCALCQSVLGWKYIAAAEETQRYKVGKYILETKRVGVWTRWEDDGEQVTDELIEKMLDGGLEEEMLPPVDAASLDTTLEDVEFDSQDEDECEDLFMGIWTPEAALRRRTARGHFASAGFGSG